MCKGCHNCIYDKTQRSTTVDMENGIVNKECRLFIFISINIYKYMTTYQYIYRYILIGDDRFQFSRLI